MRTYENYEFRFPKDFLLGTAHSAFQSEGAADRDGRSQTMIEKFAVDYAGQPTPNRKSGTISTDTDLHGCFFYDHWEEYVDDMAKTGQNTFRLSLAWPRIIPTGVGEVNPKGVEYYNKLIDRLLEKGITPFVDLCHWDLPQCLYEKGGYGSEEFPDWYEAYCKVCFEAFGDRVKLWSTFNEPAVAVHGGMLNGVFPPYEKGVANGMKAEQNVLIAHFRAVRLYKSMNLGGKIGAVHCMTAVYPASLEQKDIEAARRQVRFRFDLWLEPMMKGTYPKEILELPAWQGQMPENYQEILDKYFIPMDFVGLNYYCPSFTGYDPNTKLLASRVENFYAQPGVFAAIYPAGLFDAVMYIQDTYDHMEMYISENGLGMTFDGDEEKECNDDKRISYIREHLRTVTRCIKAGANLKGYYYWDDADCYEVETGYAMRFGLTWVNYETGERKWKKSRYYFQKLCKNMAVD